MNMMKALVPSAILTLILSFLIGAFGAPPAFLNLQEAVISGYSLYWSWTLFFIAMALNGGLVLIAAQRERSQASEPLA